MADSRLRIIIDAIADGAKGALGAIAKDLKATGTAATEASSKMGNLKGGLNDAVKGLTGFDLATVGTTAVVAGLAAGLKYSIAQAAESEKIMAQTAAVIKSTGGAAGLTAAEIENMAGALQHVSTFDDEAIQKGENLLLTFTNIGKDVFPQATAAMVDMATAMGTDVSGGAIQLGKALNNPIEGISALTRVGVTFTQEQKDLIKTLTDTGDAAGAQKVILAELNKEFGGSAQAQVNTYSGQMTLLKNNVDNVAESIGTRLLPPLTVLANRLNEGFTLQDRYTAVMGELTVQEKAAIVASDNLGGAWGTRERAIKALTDAEERLTEKQAALDAEVKNSAYLWEAAFGVIEHAVRPTQDIGGALDKAGKAAHGASGGFREVGQRAEALEGAFNNLSDAMTSAALSGVIDDAQKEYLSVIEKTTPEIAKLTAQIGKWQAAQGKSYTVTKDATTSANEYELATLKAAAAQQKLADYTDDDALKLAQLRVNADNAQDSVVKLGEGFGITEQFTLDYTKKIQEAGVKLDEFNATNATAEEQLRKTTAQFVLQQAAGSLTGQALLDFAHNTGLMNDASYNLAGRVQFLTGVWDLNKDGQIDVGKEMDGLSRALAEQTNRTVDATTKAGEMQPVLQGSSRDMYDLRDAANDTGIAIEKMPTKITPINTSESWNNLEGVRQKADEVRDAIGNIPTALDININFHQNGNSHVNETTGIGGGAASGADFIVPPGFPNDTYPLRVQSGEHVQVTPAGQAGGGGDNYYVTINDQLAGALFAESIRRKRMASLDALM